MARTPAVWKEEILHLIGQAEHRLEEERALLGRMLERVRGLLAALSQARPLAERTRPAQTLTALEKQLVGLGTSPWTIASHLAALAKVLDPVELEVARIAQQERELEVELESIRQKAQIFLSDLQKEALSDDPARVVAARLTVPRVGLLVNQTGQVVWSSLGDVGEGCFRIMDALNQEVLRHGKLREDVAMRVRAAEEAGKLAIQACGTFQSALQDKPKWPLKVIKELLQRAQERLVQVQELAGTPLPDVLALEPEAWLEALARVTQVREQAGKDALVRTQELREALEGLYKAWDRAIYEAQALQDEANRLYKALAPGKHEFPHPLIVDRANLLRDELAALLKRLQALLAGSDPDVVVQQVRSEVQDLKQAMEGFERASGMIREEAIRTLRKLQGKVTWLYDTNKKALANEDYAERFDDQGILIMAAQTAESLMPWDLGGMDELRQLIAPVEPHILALGGQEAQEEETDLIIQPLQFINDAVRLQVEAAVEWGAMRPNIAGYILGDRNGGGNWTADPRFAGRPIPNTGLHQHLNGGSNGISFYYQRTNDNVITPIVYDYATGRGTGSRPNDYQWMRSGEHGGPSTRTP